MLKEKARVIRRAKMILDALVVTVAFFVAYFLRLHFHAFYKFNLIPSEKVIGEPFGLDQYLRILILWVPLWVIMLGFNGLYRSFRTRSFLEITWGIIKSAFLSVLAFGGLAFVLRLHFVSRVFFVIFVVTSCVLLILERWAIVSVSHHMRSTGYNLRRLLIVGTGRRAERFIKMIKAHHEWGLRISGLVDDDPARVNKEYFGIKVIGVLADIPRILRERVIDEVIFVVPRQWLERIQKSIAACEVQGVRTSVAADLFDLRIARARQTDLNGFPLMSFETTFGHEWELLIKRLFDLMVSFLGLILLFPFLLITAILVKFTSRGPVFFRQKRIGVNGRIFTLYKFRTMLAGAEEKLAKLESLNEMDGPVFKIKDDPRITSLGRFLRKFSIDELPQLFNIFVGHMSLVGPRPPIPGEVGEYAHWQKRRLSMRPGLTCFWQISGRNKISFKRWMELDLQYIDNWSLWLDFEILMRTIPVVLFGIGAS